VRQAEVSHAETAPESTEEEVQRNLPFNFGVLLGHGLLGQTGFRLIQAPTFLPKYVELLAGNNTAVGIARAVQSLGMFLSPVLAARTIEYRPRIKGLGILYGAVMRLQFLFLALIALLVPVDSALGVVWLVLFVFGLALGMQGVVFSFIISKTVPVGWRGRLQGLRNAAAGTMIIFVSAAGGYLVGRFGFPAGYGYTFLLGFVLTALGLGAFAMVRESASEDIREPATIFSRVREIPALLGREPAFRRFLAARLLGTAARGALPFYVIFIGDRFGLSGARLGALTIAFTVGQSFSGLGWGTLADRLGFRVIFIGALCCWIVGTVTLLSPRFEAMYVVYLLVGAGMGGFMLSSQNLVLEFGTSLDRPMRIATANTLSELVGVLGFLGAGLLADSAPLFVVFVVATCLQLGALATIRTVAEPRIPVEPTVPLD
jgi:MFS family permease